MQCTRSVAATVLSAALMLQVGVASAMDDEKTDPMGKDAMKK